MKKILITLLILLPVSTGISQVVTTDPAIPLDSQPVTITFHSNEGNKGLMNYTGDDVYAHTGVITDESTSNSDWRYVKAEWNVNIASCKLEKISANEYQLVISPDIRGFYGVPAGEKILQLAFVFRNANGSITGRADGGADIFTPVYELGLQVSITAPGKNFTFVADSGILPVTVNASESDSIVLYLDNERINSSLTSPLEVTLPVSGFSRHMLVAAAYKDDESAADTAWYMVPSQTPVASLVDGLQDGINYIAEDSVVFVLFAPGKTYIYLIGDFNDWLPDSSWQLAKDGDRFWIAAGNLTPGKEYAFQYLIDGGLIIADPYSEKILDPFNDKFIPATVYPNLMPYPETKTSEIAGVIEPGKEQYIWNEGDYTPPDKENLIIYELLIRDFVSSHDIKEVADKLDYLETLGVNAIELMPFNEFEGNSSWGYNPSYYFATDKYYGSNSDFKDFINECHKRGIAVIMDIVLNHAYGQNPMVRMYYNSTLNQPAADNPWFNEQSPNTVFSWGYDFNHESAATQYFVDRVTEYWLNEFRVDGFRFDFTKGFTNTPGDGSTYDESRISILKRIYVSIQTVNPDAYMICEHFAPNNEEQILSDYGMLIWGNVNYNYGEAAMSYLNNSDFSRASYITREWSKPHLVSYMESHDEERLMFKNLAYGNSNDTYNIRDTETALQRMELTGVFFLTIPGPKMIWQFGELGYDYSIEYNGRLGEKPVKWEYVNNAQRYHLYLIWAKLIDLKKNYPVFGTSDYTLNVGNNIALKKITLRHGDGDVIVIGNFGLVASEMQPEFTATGKWYDIFSGDSIDISDVNHIVNLEPGEYRIYAQKKMESVINDLERVDNRSLEVYPNPANNYIYLETDNQVDEISIYSTAGVRLVYEQNVSQSIPIDISALPEGFYIIKAGDNKTIRTGKFIKKR